MIDLRLIEWIWLSEKQEKKAIEKDHKKLHLNKENHVNVDGNKDIFEKK